MLVIDDAFLATMARIIGLQFEIAMWLALIIGSVFVLRIVNSGRDARHKETDDE